MLRQAFLLTAMCLWPLFIFAAISPRRRRVLIVSGIVFLIIGWLLLTLSMIRINVGIWSDSQTPYTPFRVGPSMYSLSELAMFLGLIVWMPSLLVYILIRLIVRRRQRTDLLPKATFSHIIFFATFGLFVGWSSAWLLEYAHEDTIWSSRFTFYGWNQVNPGMTRDDVIALLGQPIPDEIQWGFSDADKGMERLWWVRNWSAGYFAVIWFDEDVVHKKQFWYSD